MMARWWGKSARLVRSMGRGKRSEPRIGCSCCFHACETLAARAGYDHVFLALLHATSLRRARSFFRLGLGAGLSDTIVRPMSVRPIVLVRVTLIPGGGVILTRILSIPAVMTPRGSLLSAASSASC